MNEDETPLFIRQVEIQEYYKKEDEDVYRYWKFSWQTEFTKEKTPFPDIPYVSFNHHNNLNFLWKQ